MKRKSYFNYILVLITVILVNFHKWKNWKKIPELAKIVVFARPNYSKKALSSIAAKKLKKEDWIYLNYKKIDISSSLIRKF